MAEEKKILVLGAGLVARPLVQYLLKPQNFKITVASRTVSKAEKLIEGHARGVAKSLNVTDKEALSAEIRGSDLVVSLLPATLHMEAAKLSLEHGKHFFTTSYVKPDMKALDKDVRTKRLLFMNELGVDPGIDHMSAMKVFDDVRGKAGKIVSFKSYCGGLPAPEANTNPWGYKFSWSPKAVLLAGKNPFKYRKDGKLVEEPGEKLFYDWHILDVPGLGEFEAYPNRDSMGYIELYNLDGLKTMYRGTLRNKGWCETWQQVHKVNLLSEKEVDLSGATYAKMMSMLIGKGDEDTIRKDVATHCGIDDKSHPVKWFEWLGLFSKDKIPFDKAQPIDVFADLMLKKCPYEQGERDMIILHHEFLAEFKDHKEKITSTLIDYGIPNGDSSMSRTVGLPCAIGARLFLEGKFKTSGVKIPVDRDVYMPILAELENQNIRCVEKVTSDE